MKLVNGFLLIAIVLLLGAGLFVIQKSGPTSLTCRKCNVILISIDTFGAKHSSVYDSTLDTTPFLKELVSRGAYVFDNAYSQAPWTLPSHTAMLTGEYPWSLNVWTQKNILPTDVPTIAEELQKRGYTTVAFSDGAFVRPAWHFDRGFDEFFGTTTEGAWEDLPALFNSASAWISNRSEKSKPFFVFLRPFELHDPYITTGTSDVYDIGDIIDTNLKPGGPTESEIKRMRAAYHAEVRTGDDALKEFITKLDVRGVLKNTVLIITSDHGEEFGEHGSSAAHGQTLYRELLHVPLIIIEPGLTKETRVGASVEVRSIPATIAHMVGGEPSVFSASSLVPLMSGIETEDRLVLSKTYMDSATMQKIIRGGLTADLLYKNLEKDINATNNTYTGTYQSSAIMGRWHAIKKQNGRVEVYDMLADPNEATNLYYKVWSLPEEDQVVIRELLYALGVH